MQYRVIGNVMPAVEMWLEYGESVFTQSGGMAWMSDAIAMETNTHGGFMKGLGRLFAGESMFMTTYTAQAANAEIGFSATVPGEIVPVDVAQWQGIVCQKGAFLCAQSGVSLDTVFTKRFSSGFFGGEGFILQQLGGMGTAFLEVDGSRVEKTLAPGEVLRVDTGNVVAFESTVSYEIETVRGGMNIFLGGEGLFLTRLVGPGRVILQTQNFAEFCGRIRPYMPTGGNN